MTSYSLLPTPKNVSPAVFRNVLAGATAAYSIGRKVPTVEEIRKYCTSQVASISKVISTPEFKEVMRIRGFPFDQVVLSPEQIFAVGVITNPTNRKPLSIKLKSCCISYATYSTWLTLQHFAQSIPTIR